MLVGIFQILLGVGFGVLFLLLSAGRIPQTKDPVKNAEMVVANRKLFQVCGIMMIIFGTLRGIMTIVGVSGS